MKCFLPIAKCTLGTILHVHHLIKSSSRVLTNQTKSLDQRNHKTQIWAWRKFNDVYDNNSISNLLKCYCINCKQFFFWFSAVTILYHRNWGYNTFNYGSDQSNLPNPSIITNFTRITQINNWFLFLGLFAFNYGNNRTALLRCTVSCCLNPE